MSAYQKKDVDISNKIDVNIPQNKGVDIYSKNTDQSSVPVKVPLNKVSDQFFNRYSKRSCFNNNKDVGISNKKRYRHTQQNRCQIPQNKDVDISSRNINTT